MRRLARLLVLWATVALVAATTGASAPAATVKVAFLQGEQVVYVTRNGSTLRQAVTALLAGPTAAEQRREIASAVPPGTPLRAVSVTGGVATIDLGEKFAAGTNTASLSARVTQLVLTATSVSGVKSVRLLVKGRYTARALPRLRDVPADQREVRARSRPAAAWRAGSGADHRPDGRRTRVLQQRLADLVVTSPPDAVDGKAGEQTRFAVMAFQKWQELGRDGDGGSGDHGGARRGDPPHAAHDGRRVTVRGAARPPARRSTIENGAVVRTLARLERAPLASKTPTGRFSVFRKEHQLVVRAIQGLAPLGQLLRRRRCLPRVLRTSPAQAASHGCVRVPRVRREMALRLRLSRYGRDGVGRSSTVRVGAAAVLVALVLVVPRRRRRRHRRPRPTLQGEADRRRLNMPTPGFAGRSRAGDITSCSHEGFEIELARVLAKELGVPRVGFVQRSRSSRRWSAGGPKPTGTSRSAAITITPDERPPRSTSRTSRISPSDQGGPPATAASPPVPTSIAAAAQTCSCAASEPRHARVHPRRG